MSEPQTSAKVIIYTVKGRIDVELWAREKPGHTRKFLEACQTGLLVGGSLNEISRSGDCIMFSKCTETPDSSNMPLERNARIRWRTGSLGWDCVQRRWFISLAQLHEQDQIVVIGKIVGDSIYSLRKIVDESELEADGKLLYPAAVRKVEVTVPYFEDLPAAGRTKGASGAQEPLKKVTKVRISYDDDDDDDDDDDKDDDEPIQPMKRVKIKMPAAISNSQPVEPVVHEPVEEGREQQDESEDYDDEESGDDERQASSQKIPEAGISDRERETLKLLALFEQNTKDKNILNR